MSKKSDGEGWGDVTEREVALYAIYDVLNSALDDDVLRDIFLDSIRVNYPNLSLDGAKKKKVLDYLDKNLCRLERVIVKSLEAYDYELKNCNSE